MARVSAFLLFFELHENFDACFDVFENGQWVEAQQSFPFSFELSFIKPIDFVLSPHLDFKIQVNNCLMNLIIWLLNFLWLVFNWVLKHLMLSLGVWSVPVLPRILQGSSSVVVLMVVVSRQVLAGWPSARLRQFTRPRSFSRVVHFQI